jgi:hypothetical protein
MNKTTTYIIPLLVLVLILCRTNNNQKLEQAEINNLAASVYDSKSEAKSKIYTPDVINKEYSTIIESYGEPINSIYVNSTSAKGRMPLYLANFLSSKDTIITAKVCRWDCDTLYREICFGQQDSVWVAIGGSIQNIIK